MYLTFELWLYLVTTPTNHSNIYSNPKWFVEAHPFGVRFHKPQKSTNEFRTAIAILIHLSERQGAAIGLRDSLRTATYIYGYLKSLVLVQIKHNN
jgi:hypothetical protein